MKKQLGCALVIIVLFASACGDDDTASLTPTTDSDEGLCPGNVGDEVIAENGYDGAGTSITLVTHDSFAVSDGTLEAFTDQTGIEVEVITAGDTGDLVASSILTAGDDPLGDVIFGIDNTFACRAVNEGVLVPYRPADLNSLVEEALLDDAGF
ncbi:MAG: thiamine ABC transporter substrate-binding protein, partial [Acidobacteria bacterium]|nr:thiamine ABC transporter substrate-binding protein [Acidobacteriota bacterium]